MMKIYPTINGRQLASWNAKMVNYSIGAAEYSDGHIFPPNAMFPVGLDGNVGLRQVVLEMDFEGTAREIAKNISNLTKLFQRGTEVFLPDGFFYRCVYVSATAPEEKAPWIKRCNFNLSGVCHDALHSELITQSGSIVIEGNRKTPVIFTITPADDTTEVSVNGITVKDIRGVVIIDGIDKTVMENGVNKFADTEITEFPSLNPGDQYIQITGATSVAVDYYPIYV